MLNYKGLSNKKLIRLCIDKDRFAWFEFVRRFKNLVAYAVEERLRRWAYRYSPSDIEDIRQDIFLAVWEKELLKTLRQPQKIVTWLAILSANTAVNYFKKKSQAPPDAASLFEDDKIPEVIDRQNPNPLETAVFKDTFKNILEIIKKLSAKERNVLRLCMLYQRPPFEAAGLLGMPLGSVYSIIHRAKLKIKKGLDEKI